GIGQTVTHRCTQPSPRSARFSAATVPAADEETTPKPEKSAFEEVIGSRMAQNVARQAARTVTQQVIRGIFGMLKGR
ncbi:MAG: hypothetical protein ACXW29_12075, partial [Thermoanaerobaculia bacterium]